MLSSTKNVIFSIFVVQYIYNLKWMHDSISVASFFIQAIVKFNFIIIYISILPSITLNILYRKQVFATDADLTSALSFSIDSDPSGQFLVDQRSGRITSRVQRLTCPCYPEDDLCRCSLTLRVTDAGGLADTAYLTVTLIDVNNHSPTITVTAIC